MGNTYGSLLWLHPRWPKPVFAKISRHSSDVISVISIEIPPATLHSYNSQCSSMSDTACARQDQALSPSASAPPARLPFHLSQGMTHNMPGTSLASSTERISG